jgi:hypothetical protein
MLPVHQLQRLALSFKKKLIVSLNQPAGCGRADHAGFSGDVSWCHSSPLYQDLNAQLPAIMPFMLDIEPMRRNMRRSRQRSSGAYLLPVEGKRPRRWNT